MAEDNKKKIYHISKRKEDGKWQVKFANGERALKLFDTQAEAIDFAKEKAKNLLFILYLLVGILLPFFPL